MSKLLSTTVGFIKDPKASQTVSKVDANMTFNLERKLARYSEQIRDSVAQLVAYYGEQHIINEQSLQSVVNTIQTMDINAGIRVVENSKNLLEELGKLLKLEAKRRTAETEINEKSKKGFVKQQRSDNRRQKLAQRRNPYIKCEASHYNLRSSDDSQE